MTATSIITISDLTFHYDAQPVLERVTLRVERGEFVGLIGPNGGGKTTLLRILLGLERNYTGTVRIFGEDPARSHHWRRRVGVVPQTRHITPRFPLRGRDVVATGTQIRGLPALSRTEREARVDAALESVGATEFAVRPLWRLSGGQQQRIFVARALVMRPELLLLDEPTVGVDAQGQDQLLQWITHWKTERGITVILVSHDVGVIAPLADKLACLNVQLHFHDRPDRLTGDDIQKAYGCPAEVVFHSGRAVPHVVVHEHRHP